MSTDPTFTGKPLSRKERAEAHRRAQARAAARAAATAARQAPQPGRPVPVVSHTPAPARATTPPPAAAPVAPVAPVAPAAPWLPGSLPAAPPPVAGAQSPVSRGMDQLEGGARSLSTRVRGQWGPRTSTLAVTAGALAIFASLAVAVAVGGPVLGHPGRPVVALAGAAGAGAGVLWFTKGWRGAGRRLRALTAASCALLCATFTVGVISDPVVIDGQVYLATSREARSVELMRQIRVDLLALAEADRYLTYDPAQAGAHYAEYAGVRDRLLEMSSRYASLSEDPGAWPDPRFADVLEHTTAASFWAAQAMESKLEVIDAGSARSTQELGTRRAAYAEAVIQAGADLQGLAAELDLPLTQMGPVE